ncbi:TIGR01621 family pseudouridine synthase [Pseudidiomarina donghaiensis]|uniref:TIGR01621 family pseudouridine synthase n=1 Tax=Pseudidiomarina donghaiensis TaxID=519452 RepID=A0A432XIJ0_9GAMM|nr:TIGR01621 family pseudouridine synthase [Pseudidiomarina donghaiensis]RUO48510.1 TIGR01621 family pseudouridine synthase [Pseudidiomarina donghaiensis]SFV23868.1 tRNA pseudouridine32 synthase / 23S rRNA pseudouridine746 synthase [Pseudidiomarina donghaiensis]
MRELSIVFSHPDFYVLNKPAGAPMHANDNELGVVQQLSEQLHEPLWPIHRLDTPTSGALLIGRNQQAAAALSGLFAHRTIHKTYLAICAGKPKKKQGLISGDMQKVRRGNWRLLHSQENPAQTRFTSFSLKPGYRYYVLKPTTGRTHQLRVALKSIGVPICGDTRYGGESAEHLHLHAWKLQFEYAGDVFDITVPWPAYEHFADLPSVPEITTDE